MDFHKILAVRTVPEVLKASSQHRGLTRAKPKNEDYFVAHRYHPLVTVALVHHNRGTMMLKTLEALLSQDYWPFEMVLVDDGSTDPVGFCLSSLSCCSFLSALFRQLFTSSEKSSVSSIELIPSPFVSFGLRIDIRERREMRPRKPHGGNM